jgi:hypothetical protein
LLTARVLFEHAQRLCTTEDRYLASAGLVALQDAVELVLYCVLLERGVDERRSIENLQFTELIGAVQSDNGPRVPRTGTLRAMHQQRNTVKHYAQLVEPVTVRHFFTVATQSLDTLLRTVIGKPLPEVLAHEILNASESRDCLERALAALPERRFLDALVEVRKAIFLEIEADYAVDEWRNVDQAETFWSFLGRKHGSKAPWYARNKQHIDTNVTTPFEFVVLDHERVQLDLMTWGASVQDFWNIWRLTPRVFRFAGEETWLVEWEASRARHATEDNAGHCVDRALSILLGKQRHELAATYAPWEPSDTFRIRVLHDQPVYLKASSTSKELRIVRQDEIYRAESVVPGLDGTEYIRLLDHRVSPKEIIFGYIPSAACQRIEVP